MKTKLNSVGETEFEWQDEFGSYILSVKNCSDNNPEHALQFSIREIPLNSKRSKFQSFSLPKEAIEIFKDAINK